jgi:hypothetical protein
LCAIALRPRGDDVLAIDVEYGTGVSRSARRPQVSEPIGQRQTAVLQPLEKEPGSTVCDIASQQFGRIPGLIAPRLFTLPFVEWAVGMRKRLPRAAFGNDAIGERLRAAQVLSFVRAPPEQITRHQ